MSFFKGKTIAIVSQQDWGKMLLSKHHYAIELAKQGAKVFFIEGPKIKQRMDGEVFRILPTEFQNLIVVQHAFGFPIQIKFRSKTLFYFLVKRHIRKLEHNLNCRIDIVWSFDISNTLPLSFFNKTAYKIFMPVDEPYNTTSSKAAAKGANILFSITNEIIAKYKHFNIPSYFINHGVQDIFFKENDIQNTVKLPINVGLSGNFLRPDLDWENLLKIITENKNVCFNFFGNTDLKDSNLLVEEYNVEYLKTLKQLSNVNIHGVLSSHSLANAYNKIDAFLICYDIEKDQSKGTNYHKLMEFLATGKSIISNNVTTYQATKDLIYMPHERHNLKLPELFASIINDLEIYNAESLKAKRISFAKEHTYTKNVDKIAHYISANA